MDPTLYAWKGADGNVYARSSNFAGVQTLGTAGATTAGGGTAVTHPNGTVTYLQLQADPNAPAANAGTTTTTTPTNNYGGYGTLADQQAAEGAKLTIQQGLDSANSGISRLGTQEQVGNANIDRDYQAAIDQLLGQETIANRDYTTSRTGQVNDYLGARSNNSDNARTWLEGARRTLGAEGAGGGSAARYGIPFEAQTMATRANSQAQGTNNKNLIALDTNHADTEDKFKNANTDVGRQRDQGKTDLESKILQQRATLLDTIAKLTGQMNIANGGDYKSALAASQGYSSQIPTLLSQIDALSATPGIKPMAVTVNAPTLDGYNYARPDGPVIAQQDPSLTNNPVYAALFGNQDQKQQQQQPILQPA